MKLCDQCNQQKPPDAFKRRASLAQSRAWTKNPAMRIRLEYESAVCNECARTHTRPTMSLSPAEARKRMHNEGKTELEISETLKRMRKSALDSKRMTILKNRQAMFAETYTNMAKQLDREKKRAMRAPDLVRLDELKRANEIFKRLKNEGKKVPMRWEDLLSKKFATRCSKHD